MATIISPTKMAPAYYPIFSSMNDAIHNLNGRQLAQAVATLAGQIFYDLNWLYTYNRLTEKYHLTPIPLKVDLLLGYLFYDCSISGLLITPYTTGENKEYFDFCKRAFDRLTGPDSPIAESKTGIHWELRVINDPAPEAFCMSGGKLAITTGLIQQMKNHAFGDGEDPGLESRIEAVLAHEIVHGMNRHSTHIHVGRVIIKSIWSYVLYDIFVTIAALHVIVLNSTKIVELGLSRKFITQDSITYAAAWVITLIGTLVVALPFYWHKQSNEFEADRLAMKLIKWVHPQEEEYLVGSCLWLGKFFVETSPTRDTLFNRLLNFQETHPLDQRRLEACNETWRQIRVNGLWRDIHA